MLGKMFKSLFGSSGDGNKGASKATTVDYDGYLIVAQPQLSNGQWQVSGRIEKQVGETTKVHTFIRADTLPDEEAAQKIAEHFGEFMTFILQSQSLMSAMTQQTLSIQQGLDQVEPRGLQDPMYEP